MINFGDPIPVSGKMVLSSRSNLSSSCLYPEAVGSALPEMGAVPVWSLPVDDDLLSHGRHECLTMPTCLLVLLRIVLTSTDLFLSLHLS